MDDSLTAQQSRFVTEFIRDLDGSEAAIRAGCSVAAARQFASENLAKPEIQDAVARAHRNRVQNAVTDRDLVIAELKKIAFADVSKIAPWNSSGELILASLEQLGPDERAAIADITRSPGGAIRVRMYSKLDALEKLARYYKIYRDAPAEVTDDLSSEERIGQMRRQFAALVRKATGNVEPEPE